MITRDYGCCTRCGVTLWDEPAASVWHCPRCRTVHKVVECDICGKNVLKDNAYTDRDDVTLCDDCSCELALIDLN
jgi:hypothetical protein